MYQIRERHAKRVMCTVACRPSRLSRHRRPTRLCVSPYLPVKDRAFSLQWPLYIGRTSIVQFEVVGHASGLVSPSVVALFSLFITTRVLNIGQPAQYNTKSIYLYIPQPFLYSENSPAIDISIYTRRYLSLSLSLFFHSTIRLGPLVRGGADPKRSKWKKKGNGQNIRQVLYDRRAVNEAAGILTRSLSVAPVCMLNGSREDKSFVPAGSSLLCPPLFFFPPLVHVYIIP